MNGSRLAHHIVAPVATMRRSELTPVDSMAVPHLFPAVAMRTSVHLAVASRTINGTEWTRSNIDCLEWLIETGIRN